MNSEILTHFKSVDHILYEQAKLAAAELVMEVLPPEKYFYRLARSIAFQQLAGKAAQTIWGRFEDLCGGGEQGVTPEKVLAINVEQMRACGLSNAKANYIHNIATAFQSDANYSQLDHLSNDEVIELLTKIKGVGQWTAEMFLMFTLGREDVFSVGDWGLVKGMMKLYGLTEVPKKKEILEMSAKWQPYRTYAALTLWHLLDSQK